MPRKSFCWSRVQFCLCWSRRGRAFAEAGRGLAFAEAGRERAFAEAGRGRAFTEEGGGHAFGEAGRRCAFAGRVYRRRSALSGRSSRMMFVGEISYWSLMLTFWARRSLAMPWIDLTSCPLGRISAFRRGSDT